MPIILSGVIPGDVGQRLISEQDPTVDTDHHQSFRQNIERFAESTRDSLRQIQILQNKTTKGAKRHEHQSKTKQQQTAEPRLQ